MVRMYIVTNTAILFVVCLLILRHNYMFRPSMLAIFRLYMRKLINKLCQHVWGVYSLWGGVGARYRFVLEKRVWTGAV